jgi:hypothetical protein
MWVQVPAGNGFPARLAATGRRGKLASGAIARHRGGMRRLFPIFVLFLSACATQPGGTGTPPPVTPAASAPDQHDHRTVNGMTAAELIEHFGRPKLQIVEAQSTKLQFAGPNCVLDIYLYPPENGSGPARATYIEARNFQGGHVSAQACAAAIEQR